MKLLRLVRYIAASNLSPERLLESFVVGEKNNLPKYVALQPHYNLVERQKFETHYTHLVEKFGLSVFPYWSLASGFLTGKYRSEAAFEQKARGGGIKKYFNAEGIAVLAALDKVSAKQQSQPATVVCKMLFNRFYTSVRPKKSFSDFYL